MADTSSISWPNMFSVSQNTVGVLQGDKSILNRVRLLLLTDPTELFNELGFGVGLKKYLWQYNTDNTRAILQDEIKAQLAEWEPCVDAENTSFISGTAVSSDVSIDEDINKLKMTVILRTIFGDDAALDLSDVQDNSNIVGDVGQ